MYEELAWENFCKTGNLESFLEYKKINRINKAQIDDFDITEYEGNNFNGFDKSKRNSN